MRFDDKGDFAESGITSLCNGPREFPTVLNKKKKKYHRHLRKAILPCRNYNTHTDCVRVEDNLSIYFRNDLPTKR